MDGVQRARACGLTVVYTVCWGIFALFPVEGPRFLWTSRSDIPNGPFGELAARLLARGSSRGATFPSSHMAAMVAQAAAAWRPQRRMSVMTWIVALLVGVGAVYGGFDYGGAILGAGISTVVMAAVDRSNRRKQEPEFEDAH